MGESALKVKPPRCFYNALIPTAAGLLWLWFGSRTGPVAFLLAIVPGSLLLASGIGSLLWPADRRLCHAMAIGAVLSLLFAIPEAFCMGPGAFAGLVLLGMASFCAAGAISMGLDPRVEGVPAPTRSVSVFAQVAVDDAVLFPMIFMVKMPKPKEVERFRQEVIEARDFFEAQGWLAQPETYHVSPPELSSPTFSPGRSWGIDFERLSFESGYEPRAEEPGRDRWLGYERNRNAYAYVLRHPGEPRPWLVCIHGYQNGIPFLDFPGFRVKHWFQRVGLNLLLPVLPLHGPRRKGWISGDGFFSGDLVDAIHAEAQAMWDIRRLLSWIRTQDPPKIGVCGLSLGGYNTSLFACLAEDLACAIPGIPATDFAGLFWHHAPVLDLKYMEQEIGEKESMQELMRVVSPLAMQPKVPKEKRLIFAATADQLVPPAHVMDLWQHWDEPRILWCHGGHLSVPFKAQVREGIEETLRTAGMMT